MTLRAGLILSLFLATPALAESHDPFAPTGDAEAGAKAFKKCVACHVVVNDEGEKLEGRKGKSGPNLFASAGHAAGQVDGYKYGKSMKMAGEGGDGFEPLMWNEANFVAYVQDPKGFLREYLGDKKARAKMSFRVKNEQDALDLYAFLHSLNPPAMDAEAAESN